ncbi:gamma-glutamyltransferase family protein [Paenalkalicoccus suaedae]|uniref:Gamma-glutamyltransferase family protein n=1 Tax=Paenalkalicoccus suaedae TaxID=2592382 RepID=A0A859FEG3_9BACI|nr:gamma-glutamyltransferase family protein [Paenalkalicoccus suaedae]QKS70616.1 gamma-glutamyltransferase family protein [Paenalkalicoccus suaedae]
MNQKEALHYPYASQRNVQFARNGMVATSQPLAAQAGLDILKQGGNAIDAAIATAACLTVVEPTSNGIGSDAFAIVWTKDKEIHGLNASGQAPSKLSLDAVNKLGYEKEMPKFGLTPVTVPGAPAAWASLSKKFGKLSLKQTLAPAVKLARDGFPVSPTLSFYWQKAFEVFSKELKEEQFKAWFDTFAPTGKAPEVGEMWKSEGHASTLEKIGETDANAFYQGELADAIHAFSKEHGGFIRKKDLENYEPEWVDPINVTYKGYDVWEIPPNGQGMIALMALQMLKDDTQTVREDEASYHKQIEAMKLAFADGEKYITEEQHMSTSVDELLSDSYAKKRRALIGEEALTPEAGDPKGSGTVYLSTADGEGNMVSFIQSNYMGFGSGIVIPGTGISLQNRGHNFSLDAEHDNALAPGKRTYHTIIPGFLSKNGEAVGPFGVMGGFMQPQGHMQVVMNTVDFHLNPQAALDAPRWQWMKGKQVLLEQSVPNHIALALAARGHEIQVTHQSGSFGRGQIIWRDPKTGVLQGGTEPRTDGAIAAY